MMCVSYKMKVYENHAKKYKVEKETLNQNKNK
jgi:hypothetical protein